MDATRKFSPIDDEHRIPMREALRAVYSSLQEKGYDPLNQIVGYLLSLDRDELMQELVRSYLGIEEEEK